MLNSIVIGIVSGVVVIFIAWTAKWFFLSRRLFLIQPKLFDYSDLVNNNDSKTLELTAINSGGRSEEDIEVQLSPVFRYTVIASNTAGLKVNENGILKIGRLAPGQESTVILTAEGGEFRKEHISRISSKEAVGKITNTLQEAQLSPQQNILIIIVLFLLLPLSGYLIGKYIVEDFLSDLKVTQAVVEEKSFSVENETVDLIGADEKTAKLYKETFKIKKVERKGNLIRVTLLLHNNIDKRISYVVSSTSTASDRRNEYSGAVRYIIGDVMVYPGATKEIYVEDFLPEDIIPQILIVEITVHGPAGRVSFTKDLLL